MNKMTKKSFFREREDYEIAKMEYESVNRQKGLVQTIMSLAPERAVRTMFSITPPKFSRGNLTPNEASKKCFKYGDFVPLGQPRTQQGAYKSRRTMQEIMRESLEFLGKTREEDINCIGYSYRAIQGNENIKRLVPFVFLPQAARLFAYATLYGGLDVEPYGESSRARDEGALVICRVPSSEKKSERYKVAWMHVPVVNSAEKRAICWSLKPKYSEGSEPEVVTYNEIRNDALDECSEKILIGKHSIAAYYGIMKHFKEEGNIIPFHMNPFILISKATADFYKKISNNLLVFDNSLKSKLQFRKPHMDEKSILLARFLGETGFDNFVWNPERDGRFSGYDWAVK